MSPGMCVNLCKDGDFRFFFKEMPACAGMTTSGRFSRYFQGDARLRGHDKMWFLTFLGLSSHSNLHKAATLLDQVDARLLEHGKENLFQGGSLRHGNATQEASLHVKHLQIPVTVYREPRFCHGHGGRGIPLPDRRRGFSDGRREYFHSGGGHFHGGGTFRSSGRNFQGR